MIDRWGIADGFHTIDGAWQPTSDETREALRAAMGEPQQGPPLWFVPVGEHPWLLGRCVLVTDDGSSWGEIDRLPPDLPIGYHLLHPSDGGPTTTLVVHPRRCPRPPRAWGIAAQLYSMWSHGSWGIGDLADLADLMRWCAEHGAGAVLSSPLHAPALCAPMETSPYYPSTRRFLNPLHIAIGRLPNPALAVRPGKLIDREAVWAAKREALLARRASESDGESFGAWRAGQPGALARYGQWCALAERFGPDWMAWPAELRRPGPTIDTLVASDDQLRDAAAFHEWTQWVAAAQLRAAAHPDVALIGDLAVGFDPHGFDAWDMQDLLADDALLGAPPDDFNADGQQWNIPPFVPWRLRNAAYQPFAETVRAALTGMQGLRVDHVMGMFRQFWIPPGGGPADGGYVHFPAEEILAVLALEAERAGAFVVGEDLGVVEPRVRAAMEDHDIAGTRVFWFAEEPAPAWDELALATVTTHDLPTIVGVHSGRDGTPEMRARLHDVARPDASPAEAVVAVHAHIAQAPSLLRLAALDDLALSPDRPNAPGTTREQRPNWCIPLAAPLRDILGSAVVADVADALGGRRDA